MGTNRYDEKAKPHPFGNHNLVEPRYDVEGAEGGLCKELASERCEDVKMSDMLFSWLKNHRSRVNWLVVEPTI